ncbi:hypothetical protein [Teredinibacter turnerae]|nr:hypothetical protein [Teredinibacter turnerae]
MVISSLILRSETDAILGLPVRRTAVGSTAGRTGLYVFSWQLCTKAVG